MIITQCSLESTWSFGSSVRSVCTRNWLKLHDGHQNDEELQRLPCEERLEGMGLVQLSEEVALEEPESSLVIPEVNNAEGK